MIPSPIEVINFHNYRSDSYYIRRLDAAAVLIERLRNSGLNYRVEYVENDPAGWWFTLLDQDALSFFCLMITIKTSSYKPYCPK